MSNRRLIHPSGSHFWHEISIVATPMAYPNSMNFLNAIAPSQLNKGTPYGLCRAMAPGHLNRLRQRALDRPAAFQPIPKSARVHAQASGPFGDRKRLASVSERRTGASIVALLDARRPAAVARRVVAVVVDAFQSSALGSRAHVGVEVRKLVPARTDLDAAPAVTRERGARWIRAALPHGLPHLIFGCPATRVTMRHVRGLRVVLASARLGISAPEVVTVNRRCRAACATAFDLPMATHFERFADYREEGVGLAQSDCHGVDFTAGKRRYPCP
jgi:hypothetical protein